MSQAKIKPIWSLVSLATLFVNAVVVVTTTLTTKDYIVFIIVDFWLAITVSALGVLFAVVSFLRRERYFIVSLLALTLNAAPFFWLWSIRNKQLFGP
jgi:hypothetical protein